MKDPVVAVCVSDTHLSLTPPIARAEEPDWLEAMARPWNEVRELAKGHGAVILVAGDVFDRWNAPAELVNWALQNLPQFYGIAGNHDLPGHSNELVHRSAFQTLVHAGTVRQLTKKPTRIVGIHGITLCLYGAKLGKALPRTLEKVERELHVGLVHEFVWVPGSGYEGAPEDERLRKKVSAFSPYDVVVIGDNHQHWTKTLRSGTRVMNCGTLMRRKSNETDYRPTATLIHRSGEVTPHELDTSKDHLTELMTEGEPEDSRMAQFVRELTTLEGTSLDFREVLRRSLRRAKVRKSVRLALLKALGE